MFVMPSNTRRGGSAGLAGYGINQCITSPLDGMANRICRLSAENSRSRPVSVVTSDGGVTWTLVRGPDGRASALSGNRTAVSYVPGAPLVLAAGRNGADLSRDDGVGGGR
jgi:hypothetical protein